MNPYNLSNNKCFYPPEGCCTIAHNTWVVKQKQVVLHSLNHILEPAWRMKQSSLGKIFQKHRI